MKFRSPHLLDRSSTALLVIDVQEKLIPVIDNAKQVVENCQKLTQAASILSVPTLVSEQYTKGLGLTTDDLAIRDSADVVAEKTMFSCRECDSINAFLADRAIQTVLLCGIEAHVCVAQSAFDLLAAGLNVQIAADATGSRNAEDRDRALTRMSMHGIAVSTTEAAVFELCETASATEFKQISQLVK